MRETKDKQRTEWIDIAKGIAIFLMVMGHTSIPQPISSFIWAFHMPFFFFMSGMLFCPQKYEYFGKFVLKRGRSLVIPYVIATMIVALIAYVFEMGYSFRVTWGWESYPLWFLEALVIIELLQYVLIKKLCKGKKLAVGALSMALLFLGFVFSKQGIILPYKLHVVPWGAFFYGVGFLAKDAVSKLKGTIIGGMVLFTAVFGISRLTVKTDMCINMYGNIVLNNANALLGIIALILFAKGWEHWTKLFPLCKKFFLWAGQNTMIIMAFSAVYIATTKILLDAIGVPGVVSTLLRHLTNWVVLWLAGSVLQKSFYYRNSL